MNRLPVVASVTVAVAAGLATVSLVAPALQGGASPSVTTVLPKRDPGEGVVPLSPLEAAIVELGNANIAFVAPDKLALNEVSEVRVLLSVDQTIAELETQLSELGEMLGDPEGAQIQVSDVMTANLSGLGFAIEDRGSEEQVVAPAGVTEWGWNIEPTKSGTRRLFLTLSALISLGRSERHYTVRTFSKTLEVEVSWGERLSGFFGDNWQWLMSTLLLPIAIATWGYSRRRNKERHARLAGAGAATTSNASKRPRR
jgi:hypothetical protein